MSLSDVDREERDLVAVAFGQLLERTDLGAKRRSGVRAEDERNPPARAELGQLHGFAAVGGRESKVRADVPDVRVHDGRHTAGTILVDQGVHLRVIQEILGHSDVRVTERYTHVASPAVREAAGLMGAALWGSDSAETATKSATNSQVGDLPAGEYGQVIG